VTGTRFYDFGTGSAETLHGQETVISAPAPRRVRVTRRERYCEEVDPCDVLDLDTGEELADRIPIRYELATAEIGAVVEIQAFKLGADRQPFYDAATDDFAMEPLVILIVEKA
jgi:hypothetical protein